MFLFLPPFFVPVLVADKIYTTHAKQASHIYNI